MFEPQEAVKLLQDWKPKTVCIVSNKTDLEEDWSDKVDACDVVVRINRLCSYETDKTGKKMDLLVEDCSAPFFAFSRTDRNQHLWGDARFVLFTESHANAARHCIYREQLEDCAFIPDKFEDKCLGYTTMAISILVADKLWPEAELYFLGDIDRTTSLNKDCWPGWHETSTELDCLNNMVKAGRLVPWLTDPDKKSKPRSKVKDAPDKDFLVKKPGRAKLEYEYATVMVNGKDINGRRVPVYVGDQKAWAMILTDHLAVNGRTHEMGVLVYNAPTTVIVDWDSSGRQCYALCSQAGVWALCDLPMWAGWKPFQA